MANVSDTADTDIGIIFRSGTTKLSAWAVTPRLRFKKVRANKLLIQQMWVDQLSGEQEWREIPIETDDG